MKEINFFCTSHKNIDYWMSRNVITLRWPIAMYNRKKSIITPIGKI